MSENLGDLTAESLTLLDDEGNPRIVLSVLSTDSTAKHGGIPRISMFDNGGCERIVITIKDHPLICVLNPNGSTAVGLAEFPGNSGVAINDHTGKRAIELSTGGRSGHRVIVIDEKGRTVGSVP